MSGYGHDGPHHKYKSYGPVIQAVSGMSFISGLPEREPSGWGLSYMDNQAAYYNSAALLMAIFQRNATGKGQEVNVSAMEAGISLLGPDLLDVAVNNVATRRPGFPTGNRLAAPAGRTARCVPGRRRGHLGRDRRVRRRPVGPPRRCTRPSGVDDGARVRRLRHRVSTTRTRSTRVCREWTKLRTPHATMELLQRAGVPAARSPELARPGRVATPRSPSGEPFSSSTIRSSARPSSRAPRSTSRRRSRRTGARRPLLGEDNDYVYGNILGLERDEIAELAAEGVI